MDINFLNKITEETPEGVKCSLILHGGMMAPGTLKRSTRYEGVYELRTEVADQRGQRVGSVDFYVTADAIIGLQIAVDERIVRPTAANGQMPLPKLV